MDAWFEALLSRPSRLLWLLIPIGLAQAMALAALHELSGRTDESTPAASMLIPPVTVAMEQLVGPRPLSNGATAGVLDALAVTRLVHTPLMDWSWDDPPFATPLALAELPPLPPPTPVAPTLSAGVLPTPRPTITASPTLSMTPQRWPKTAAATAFTVQWLSGPRPQIERLMASGELPKPMEQFPAGSQRGTPLYGLIAGEFASRAEAEAMANRLGRSLRLRPLVRQLAEVQPFIP